MLWPEDGRAMLAIRANLYTLFSWYAYQDFLRTNPEGRRRYDSKGNPKPFNPYSLSPLTLEARGHYHISLKDDWTHEDESGVKAYILLKRRDGTLDKALAWERGNPWREKL